MTYNLRLKDEIATFTKQLFYALFDTKEQQEKELKALKTIFLNVVSQISVENGEGRPVPACTGPQAQVIGIGEHQ